MVKKSLLCHFCDKKVSQVVRSSSTFKSAPKAVCEHLFVEFLLPCKARFDALIDRRLALEEVIPEICVGSIHPIDAPLTLLHHLPRVVQRIKHNRVCCSTVPCLRSTRILHQVHPPIPIRHRLVLMSVPLLHDTRVGQLTQSLQLVGSCRTR